MTPNRSKTITVAWTTLAVVLVVGYFATILLTRP